MTQVPKMPEGSPDEQALYWLTLMTSGEADEASRQAFNHWLNASPAHQSAWNGAQCLWRDITKLDAADLIAADRSAKPSSMLGNLPEQRRRFRPAALGVAACVLLSALLWMSDLDVYLADYRTAIGGSQRLTLADGSIVQLNTGTAISIDYTSDMRRLTLHGGEA